MLEIINYLKYAISILSIRIRNYTQARNFKSNNYHKKPDLRALKIDRIHYILTFKIGMCRYSPSALADNSNRVAVVCCVQFQKFNLKLVHHFGSLIQLKRRHINSGRVGITGYTFANGWKLLRILT